MLNKFKVFSLHADNPDSKVHGAYMGPIRGRQDPGGSHVRPMNFAVWNATSSYSQFQEIGARFALCCVLLRLGVGNFNYILQGYFTGTLHHL